MKILIWEEFSKIIEEIYDGLFPYDYEYDYENNEEIIHYGKKFASYINSFDLVQSGEHYIIYDTSTGYSRYLI